MHSYQGKSAIFNFNGGLKGGDLIIIDKKTNAQIRIEADDVIDLVAYEYVLPEKIGKLEQASAKDILLDK
ncbi:hypothetical protein FKN04_12755 [Bacillus glycinifermentans]|uniref:hypothetical protein n=1 Tax=Bacillus glycinifermentans TaxID=1664069 RepID=UPI001583042A|nr:hypothetical protein [Bacillus glycinifermentans]NUJ17445.1 hypothetical protein [Bacillus glycinifermentans]